uniref:Chondroitin proteoglycan 4 domain-containing protein n=1 Tax=Panagrellus redivivus TaxID=6233 RepID=A0A7E5A262_PANRE
MDYTTESGFTQLCKNFTEVDKCYDNADPSSHQLCIVLESMYGRPYDCNIPIFKTVLRLCNSTYEDAMDIRNCYDNGMMQFSGSPDEAACRQKCCHDSSTFNASEP